MIRRVREQAVDETVQVAMGEKARQYPETLVNVAKLAFKRPALSLRLIGVVESKSALKGRIKHMLGRPIPKSAKLGIIGLIVVLIVVLIVGAILLPMAKAERFTDRAEEVMALADQEARRLNHEYIGTEHILLGLVREGSGVGATALKNLDVDIKKVRLGVDRLVKSGPDKVRKKKLPQTPRAKRAMEYAIEEVKALNHDYVGTEHILLGLLRVREGIGAQVLVNLGLKLEDVRQEVLNLVGRGPMKGGQPTLVITGIVTEAETGQPIAGAKVGDVEQYAEGKQWTTTDSDGNYSYQTWYEEHGIKAEAPGYKTQHKGLYTKLFRSEKTKVLDFQLTPELSRFKKKLANGVGVELVGVCEHPSKGKQWWRPDGAELPTPPYEKGDTQPGVQGLERGEVIPRKKRSFCAYR